MHAVLASFLVITSGTFHNVERLIPDPPGPVVSSPFAGGGSPYAYDEDQCMTRASGAIVCRRHGRSRG